MFTEITGNFVVLRQGGVYERVGYVGFKFRASAISFGSAVWRE